MKKVLITAAVLSFFYLIGCVGGYEAGNMAFGGLLCRCAIALAVGAVSVFLLERGCSDEK